jgi:hypothetical protein
MMLSRRLNRQARPTHARHCSAQENSYFEVRAAPGSSFSAWRMLPAGRNGPVETVTDSSHLGRLSFSFDDGFRLQFHWQVRARRIPTAAAKSRAPEAPLWSFATLLPPSQAQPYKRADMRPVLAGRQHRRFPRNCWRSFVPSKFFTNISRVPRKLLIMCSGTSLALKPEAVL